MVRDSDPNKWSAFDMAASAKSAEQETSILPDDSRALWFQRLQALDNLLTLFGLERHTNIFGGGFLIYHREAPNITRWISSQASEESWLEDVKLLAR